MVRSGTKVDQEVIDAGKNLKLIGRAGTGVDNIDVKHATSKNILVVNTPGGNTISTGELAFSHLLALARKIPQATASLKKGAWNRSEYTGSELSTKTLGIIGCGQIGKQVRDLMKLDYTKEEAIKAVVEGRGGGPSLHTTQKCTWVGQQIGFRPTDNMLDRRA